MRATRTSYITLLALIVLLVGELVVGRSAAQQTTPAGAAPLLSTAQRTFGIIGDPAVEGELMLNNNSPHATDVVPVFSVGGEAIVGKTIRMAPHTLQFFPVRELTDQPVEAIELQYNGEVQRVAGQLTLRVPGVNGTVDAPVLGPVDFASSALEAVWSAAPHTRARVTIANASDTDVSVTVRDALVGVHTFALPARATRQVTRHARAGLSVDWLRVDHDGPPGSVRAGGFVEGDLGSRRRIVGNVRFYDPGTAMRTDLYATNVPVRDTVLQVVVKNTTAAATRVTVQAFSLMDADAPPLSVTTAALGPHEATAIDVRPLQLRAGTDPAWDRVSLQVETTGVPGTVIGALTAIDRVGLARDIPLRDAGPARRSTGTYPWRLDGDHETTVTITNVADAVASFTARLTFPGGVYYVEPRQLAIGTSAVYNVRELRDQQIPDRLGNRLPPTALAGRFTWSILGPSNGARLQGRAEVVSARTGRASSFSCAICCPDSFIDAFLQPTVIEGPEGGSIGFQVLENRGDCFGGRWLGLGAWPHTWSFSNPAVATARTTGLGTAALDGHEIGESVFSGQWMASTWEARQESCHETPVNAWGGGEAQIARITPYVAVYKYDPGESHPEPHGPESLDVYFPYNNCNVGFCQTRLLVYDHQDGFGHNFLSIHGRDVEGLRRRDCYGGTPRASLTPPQCVPGRP